jgi:hypothetical protein
MNTKEHALTAIARLLEVTEAAIRLGDWKVDGACDPYAAIEYAKHVLVSGGYAQNSNDDRWTAPAPEPRSTHRVWRDGEWLPCYCLAGCDHGIGSEQPVKRDPAELVRLFNSNDWPRPGAERDSLPLALEANRSGAVSERIEDYRESGQEGLE